MSRSRIFQYLLFLVCIIAACRVSQKAVSTPSMTTSFDKQGHRGCRGLAPENTLPAMVKALDLGVTTLEMDVVITKDNKVILSHEAWFNPAITTQPDGSFISEKDKMTKRIYDMNYDDVRRYDVGLKPNPLFPRQQKIAAYKPLLNEVFDTISKEMLTRKRPFPFYSIEIKTETGGDGVINPPPKEFTDLVMGVILAKNMQEQVIIQSFDFRVLRYLHGKYPGVRISALIDNSDSRTVEQQLNDLGFIPSIYSPAFALVTKNLLDACHMKGMQVIPWTVNAKEKIIALKNLGVDGIITDYPDLFE